MKVNKRADVNRFRDSDIFKRKVARFKAEARPGDKVIWLYGCGEHMNAEYVKLRTPLMAEIESLHEHGFVSYITNWKGKKVRYFYTYKDIILGERVRPFV